MLTHLAPPPLNVYFLVIWQQRGSHISVQGDDITFLNSLSPQSCGEERYWSKNNPQTLSDRSFHASLPAGFVKWMMHTPIHMNTTTLLIKGKEEKGPSSHVNNVHFPTNPSHYSQLNKNGTETHTIMYDEFRHNEFGSGVPSYITFIRVGHSIKCLSESTCIKTYFLGNLKTLEHTTHCFTKSS
jgi:hypothetical protein